MKKVLLAIALLLTASLAFAAPQRKDTLGGSVATDYAYVSDNSNAVVTLVSGTANYYTSLYRLTVSSNTAGNFYLRCASTQKTGKVYLPGAGGLDLVLYPLYLQCGSGEALQLVKDTAGNPFDISLWFIKER